MTGKKTHDSHGDDTSQLGGNFIVDKEGVLRLIYPSHDPTDRPAVDSLLKILDDLE
jgi:alkyl hydroperoxide reductase subunit AhpC